MKGKTVCRIHGGLTPSGPASPHWVHGRYSKDIPTRLFAAYKEAMDNPEVASIDHDIALSHARISELLHAEVIDWEAIREEKEHKRKLGDSQVRRLRYLNLTVPVKEVVAYIEMVKQVMLRHVADDKTRLLIEMEVDEVIRRTQTSAIIEEDRELLEEVDYE